MTYFENDDHFPEHTRRAGRPALLLVTDRAQHSRGLARNLGLIGTLDVADLHNAPDPAAFDLLIGDVDLQDQASVLALRDLAGRAIRGNLPVLSLLRADSHHERIQARALGASATMPARAPRAAMVDAVLDLLGLARRTDPTADGWQAAATRGVRQTGALLADLLDAAAEGAAPPLEAVPEGADLVSETIRQNGLDAWLDIVWEHDDATYQHCLLVAGLAGAFAHGLGFGLDDRQRLVGGALLHDIGKARIPLPILDKPSGLNDAERAIMRRHPELGYDLLVAQGREGKEVDPDHLAIVRHHHEYLDGSGYPDGLRADRIPDIVRMITICDIHAALLERRPYKSPMSPAAALDILRTMKTRLDPDLLRAFADTVIGAAT